MLLSTNPPPLDLRRDLARPRRRTKARFRRRRSTGQSRWTSLMTNATTAMNPDTGEGTVLPTSKLKIKGIVLIMEACLVADNVSMWILDCAATNHICCSLTRFRKSKSLKEGDFSFRWGDGSSVSAKTVGSVTLSFEDRTLNVNNVYFAHSFGKNLISVARLCEQDYCSKFIKNGIRIFLSKNTFVTDA